MNNIYDTWYLASKKNICEFDASRQASKKNTCGFDASRQASKKNVCEFDASRLTSKKNVCEFDASRQASKKNTCEFDASRQASNFILQISRISIWQMRNIIFLCIVMFSSISGLSQNIHTSNLMMEQIAEIEFRDAYQNKRKSVYKWRSGDWIVKHSGVARKIYAHDEFPEIEISNMRLLKLKSKSYLLQETEPVLSKAYYMNGEALDTIAMFGIGDVDNDQIYYASPDYDCDQHLWCRWYSFTDGKVSILAELEDKSFEYDLANYDLPSFFADNRGYYYIVINKNPNIYNNVGEKKFFKIRLK